MLGKYIIASIIAVLVVALGTGLILRGVRLLPKPQEPVVQQPTTAVYSTSTFSVTYPLSFTVDSNYAYEGVPKKKIGPERSVRRKRVIGSKPLMMPK